MGPFHNRKKNKSYAIQNGAASWQIFFELLFDTATFIPSFRMIKARSCKQSFKSDRLYRIYVQHYYFIQYYNTSRSSSTLDIDTRKKLVFGTPVQLLHTQAEAVAYKPTLVRPRNSHYGIGCGRCGGCEPSSGGVEELLVLLLL